MNNDKPLVSIIIVSFNTKNVLNSCLESIIKSNLKFPHEIIIIDNNSSDGSADLVLKKFSDTKLIINKTNNLFAKANNQGAEIANGKYLLLLNSDTIIEENNLEKLVSFIDSKNYKVACVGPTVINADRTIQSSGFALPSVWERITMVFHLNRLLPRLIGQRILPLGTPGIYSKNHRTGWVSGCCMLIRRDIYVNLGGLNDQLEFYGEEPEFCLRLQNNGYETWLVKDSTIIHLGGKSSSTEFANFLTDTEGKLRRYTALQLYTVGIKKSIIMSRIVLLSAYIKRFFCTADKKTFFNAAIRHESNVIDYLKKHL